MDCNGGPVVAIWGETEMIVPPISGPTRTATRDPLWLRILFIGISLGFVGVLLVLPLAVIFAEAFGKGVGAYLASFHDNAAWQAIRLTLLVSLIAVPLNLAFGI